MLVEEVKKFHVGNGAEDTFEAVSRDIKLWDYI